MPCMRVVAHRHSQYALTAVFSGNFPGSKERIPTDAGLCAILCQSLLFYLPGLIVRTMPSTFIPNTRADKPHVTDAESADRLLQNQHSPFGSRSTFGSHGSLGSQGAFALGRLASFGLARGKTGLGGKDLAAARGSAPDKLSSIQVLARNQTMATMLGGEDWDPYTLPSATKEIFEFALFKESQMNEGVISHNLSVKGLDRDRDGMISMKEVLCGLCSQFFRVWQFYHGELLPEPLWP